LPPTQRQGEGDSDHVHRDGPRGFLALASL
jgi:hypothetical protein